MNVRHVCKWCVLSTLVALGTSFGMNKAVSAPPAIPAPPSPASAEQGVQVLTRGPVHEAFAETVTYDPEPGIVVPKTPPAAIEEVPPDQRPEGANVAWIPGYWGWDDERNDFLWVSGVWRDLPPGRQWVPGYWGKSAQGSQWTSGYWADAKATEVAILARAACDRRKWSQHCRLFGRPNMAARLLGLAAGPLCLASRFLGDCAAGLGLGSRPLRLGPAWLRFRRRLLGLLHRPSRRAVCAGVFQCGRVWRSRVSPIRRRR